MSSQILTETITQLGAIGILIVFGWQTVAYLAKRNREHVEQIDKLHQFYLAKLDDRDASARKEREEFTGAMHGVRDTLTIMTQEMRAVVERLDRMEQQI